MSLIQRVGCAGDRLRLAVLVKDDDPRPVVDRAPACAAAGSASIGRRSPTAMAGASDAQRPTSASVNQGRSAWRRKAAAPQ